LTLQCSVVICAHNPRAAYLKRTLEALQGQSLEKSSWELLLVDNASERALASEWDLSWHPHARHLHEGKLGLTHARCAGIRAAQAELLVLVDDDNVLDANYLASACKIAREFDHIGAFGGNLKGEFEVAVPGWAEPYLEGLCIKELSRDRWSNEYAWSDAIPYGAGMCIRSTVARRYAANVQEDGLRLRLDRAGGRLTSAGDLDMAWTAIDLGLGTGRFRALTALHLIPANRLTEDYLVRLYAGFAYSNNIIWAVRGLINERPRETVRDKLRHVIAVLHLRGIRRKMYHAMRKATRAAWDVIDSEIGGVAEPQVRPQIVARPE
jgi:glycosyltransferase involved in cell wall biosynthesis